MNKNDYVWYSCYGSNLHEDRFMCYIKGGKPKNSTRVEIGCKDKTPPKENRAYKLNRPLYYAKNSPHWNNGGSSFVGQTPHKDNFTLSRMYLITKEQFIDLVNQENSAKDIKINFEKAIKNQISKVADTKFGILLYIEHVDNMPVFTFTNEDEMGDSPFTKPDILYLKTIVAGLKEIYNLSNQQFVDYFIKKPGIEGNYTEVELLKGLFE